MSLDEYRLLQIKIAMLIICFASLRINEQIAIYQTNNGKFYIMGYWPTMINRADSDLTSTAASGKSQTCYRWCEWFLHFRRKTIVICNACLTRDQRGVIIIR